MSATTKTEIEAVDVDVQDWIAGVSFLQSKVTIYRDPAIFAEYEPLLAKIEQLEAELEDLTAPDEPDEPDDVALAERTMSGEEPMSRARAEDRALGEKPVEDPRIGQLRAELEPLYKRAKELYERYQNDTEVWTLRKLDQPEIDALTADAGEMPTEPDVPGKNAKPAARTLYRRRVEKYLQEMKVYTLEVNLRLLAAATLNVHVGGKDRGPVSLEQMRRVDQRPGGRGHTNALYEALDKIQSEGVEIIAPHRPGA